MQNSQLVSVLAISSLLLIVSGCDNTIRNNTVSTVTDMVTPSPQTLSNQVPLTEVKALISTPEGIAQVVKANNQFAIDMYQQINGQSKQAEKNVFFSPYSLSTAMAMLYVAAEGETKAQIQRAFYYPSLNVLNPNSAALHEQFNKPNPNYQLATANDLWIQQGLRPNQNYLDTVQRYCGGKVTPLDFKNSPEPSRQTINKTIANYTQQMIPEVLPASSIDTNTVTVLTNAVYFKGDWKTSFAPSKKRPFNTFDGSSIDVDMMHEQAPYAYTEDAQVQVVQLPYKGDELSMMVVLPKAKDKIAMQRVVNTLNAKQISQWNNNLVKHEVILDLPKFKLEESYTMDSLLATMGMAKAFSSEANFSLFSQNIPLSVDAIVHKAVVEVDEKGTKAAASTGITILPISRGYYVNTSTFTADHPFIFMIIDNKTDAILFLGQVNEP